MNKTIKSILVALFLTFGFSNLYAGAGHSHVASQNKVEKNAKRALNKYVSDGKLVSSWQNAKRIASNKTGKEWEIVFFNDSIKEVEKQKLSFFMTSYGKLKGANYRK